MVGPLSDSDMSFLDEADKRGYLNSIQMAGQFQNTLAKKFKNIKKPYFDLLDGLLKVDPAKRLTVEECIKSEIFDNIRTTRMEMDSDIIVTIESDSSDAFDYENMVDIKFARRKRYMDLILKEIDLFDQ